MSNTHPCADFAQPVGRVWATDNNQQACPVPLSTEGKLMFAGCALHASVVWLRFVAVKYGEVSGPRLGAECCPSGARTAVTQSLLEHVLLPGSSRYTAAPQLCVRQAQERSACAREWSSQQENLQRSVLNCSVLLPHHIYKILNRRAPATAFHSFLLLISSSRWSHRYRSLLSLVCPAAQLLALTRAESLWRSSHIFLVNV